MQAARRVNTTLDYKLKAPLFGSPKSGAFPIYPTSIAAEFYKQISFRKNTRRAQRL